MTAKPTIVVLGAGGMGALFGSILQQGGLNVTLVDTHVKHVEAIQKQGLKIIGYGGDRSVQIPITTDASSIHQADLILFQCKSHSSQAAAKAIKHLTDQGAVAISFQNGLGNEEVIADVLGEDKVLGGVTTMAGAMLEPGVIQDFSRTLSTIGEMAGCISERSRKIAQALSDAGLETNASENIVLDIWKKLLGNISTSAVSGVTNLTSAAALQIPALKGIALCALDEALAVAHSLDIALDRDAVVHGMEMISVAGGTGDNKTSLCVDLLNKRPTEVDFIYGSVIAKARSHNIATPTLDTLSALVKGIESHYMDHAAAG